VAATIALAPYCAEPYYDFWRRRGESRRVDLLTPQQRDVSNSDRGEPSIRLKPAHEPPSLEDGKRILVDRLWPRGIRRTDAAIDCWLKEIAPSSDLRRWFGHDPGRWEEFQNRYRRELSAHPEILNKLRALADQDPLTFVYAARDEDHNHAVALRDVLLQARRLFVLESGISALAQQVRPTPPAWYGRALRDLSGAPSH
jgi:uncharacterized protein YeaO (DUF488 family)